MQLEESLGIEDSQSGEKVDPILKASKHLYGARVVKNIVVSCEQVIISISTPQLCCKSPR